MADLTGQIGLVPHPMGFWPHIIAWVTRSTVYHSVLAIDDDTAISAEPGGAVLRPVDFWPDTIWSHYDLTATQAHSIREWGISHLDTPYGWLTDITIGLALLFKLRTPHWIAVYLSSDRRMNCSQLCDQAYSQAGIELFTDGRLPSAVYPGSFVPLFKVAGWWPTHVMSR